MCIVTYMCMTARICIYAHKYIYILHIRVSCMLHICKYIDISLMYMCHEWPHVA